MKIRIDCEKGQKPGSATITITDEDTRQSVVLTVKADETTDQLVRMLSAVTSFKTFRKLTLSGG